MATKKYKSAFSEIVLDAEVTLSDGTDVNLELSEFSMTYALNSIPTATLKVAVGESPVAEGGNVLAKVHSEATKFSGRLPVKVFSKFVGTSYPGESKSKKWKDTRKTLFEGYLHRPSYTRSTQTASLVFQAIHWLSDLAVASKISYLFHPRSSSDFLRASWRKLATVYGAAKLTELGVTDDIWEKGIKQYFLDMSKSNLIDRTTQNDLLNIEKSNQYVAQALGRFETGPGLNLKSNIVSNYEGNEGFLTQQLATMIISLTTGTSVWETLLTLSNLFKFGIIPYPTKARIVPLTHIVGGEIESQYDLTIHADEYSDIQDMSSPEVDTLPIRGVVYLGATDFTTFYTETDNDTPIGTIGIYDISQLSSGGEEPKDSLTRGQLLVRHPPAWLNAEGLFNQKDSATVPGPRGSPKTVYAPDGEGSSGGEDPKLDEVMLSVSTFGCALARADYANEVFQSRALRIAGRLRFDITPGTQVKIELIGKNIPGYMSSAGEDAVLWGHVYSINYTFSAEAPMATTTLNFSHIHTPGDRELPKLVATEHPLYTGVWNGEHLIDDIEE